VAASKRKRRRSTYTPPGRREEGIPAETAPPARRAKRERPPAPWGRFPLVELIVLVSLVLLLVGFFAADIVLIACGVTLGALAGLELSIREHLAGFKSHSTVLAGALTVLVVAAGYFLLPAKLFGVNLMIGAIVFGISFYAFREVFKRRSGGLGFR
jgi:hypothetical protein